MKNIVIVNAADSAAIIALQIPSSPKIIGRIITAADSNTKALIKEIIAEVTPSLKAVKNPDAKILNHISM